MEHPTGPSALAARLGVTTAAASGIVDRLVTRGHVERQPHPADRRRTVVACTSSGREELLGHLMPMFLELAALDARLSPTEREIVLRARRYARSAHRRGRDGERDRALRGVRGRNRNPRGARRDPAHDGGAAANRHGHDERDGRSREEREQGNPAPMFDDRKARQDERAQGDDRRAASSVTTDDLDERQPAKEHDER